MNKFYFLALAISLATATTRAQNARAQWSEKFQYKNEYITTVKNPAQDGFVMISYTPVSERFETNLAKCLVITHYDKRLQFVSEKEVPLDEKELEPVHIICMKNSFFLVSEKHRKSDNESDIDLTPLDIVNDKAGPTKAMFSYPIGSGGFLRLPKLVYSKDSGKVLIYVNYIRNNKENLQFADCVINEKGEKVWSKQFDIPVPGIISLVYDTPKFIFNQAIDNDGDVYLLFAPTEGGTGGKYRLLSIDNNGSLTHLDLALSQQYFGDAGITVNEAGNIVFCGLSKENAKGNITGYGIYALDRKTFQPVTSKESKFEPGLVAKIAEDKQGAARGENAGISDNFTISSIVAKPNGNVCFIAEFRENLQGRGSLFYNDGDLLVLEYKAAGEPSCIRVPKFQRSENANFFGSFSAFENKNNLYLLYNDCAENLQSGDNLISFAFNATHRSSLNLVVATINEKEKLSRKALLDFEDADLGPDPRRFNFISPGQIGLFGSRYKYAKRAEKAIGVLAVN